MLHSTHYKPSSIEASRSSLQRLLELNQEMIEGLQFLQLILKKAPAPIDPQTIEEAESMYTVIHRLFTKELAEVEHVEKMQEIQKKAEESFGKILAKSNPAQSATA